MDNFNQENDMIRVDENQMMEKEPKKFKWWIILIVLGALALIAIFAAIILLIISITVFTVFGAKKYTSTATAAYAAPSAQLVTPSFDDEEELDPTKPATDSTSGKDAGKESSSDDLTISDFNSMLNDSLNNPDEDSSDPSAPIPTSPNSTVDYTIVNNAYGRDADKAKDWVKRYFPDATITDMTDVYVSYWKLTQDTPFKALSIDGYIYTYDYICIDFDDNGLVKTVGFYRSSNDRNAFDKIRQALVIKYGLESESNMFDSYSSDEFSLEYYLWERFDGYSDLYLGYTYGDDNPNPEFALTISKHVL